MRTDFFFHPDITRQLAAGGMAERFVRRDSAAFDEFRNDRMVAGQLRELACTPGCYRRWRQSSVSF